MQPIRPGKFPGAPGFTLAELVIVVLLLGIIALAAVPELTAAVDNARLEAATETVAGALQYAQLSAMNSGRPCRVTVNATAETVALEQLEYTKLADIMNGANTQLAAADVETATSYATMSDPANPGKNYVVDFVSGFWFQGVDIVSVAFGAGSSLVYDALGVPSAEAQITLDYGRKQAVVSVEPATGKIRIL